MRMNTKELQEKTTADLMTLVTEKRAEIRKIRFGAAGSGMRDTRAIRNNRKAIARALTEVSLRAHGKSAHKEA